MAKYDGWVIKSIWGETSWILPWTFRLTKKEVIDYWGRKNWRNQQRKREFKLVKIKFTEVT